MAQILLLEVAAALVRLLPLESPMNRPCPRATAALAAILDGPRPRTRARILLSRYGSLRRLVAEAREPACREGGLDETTRTRILATLEFGRRALAPPRSGRLVSPADVVRACPGLWHATHEEIWVIAVDAQLRRAHRARITRGGMEQAQATAAQVLRPVLASGARSYFVLHNHPSGELTPSPQDEAFTTRLDALSSSLGLAMLDHLIVAGDSWRSCVSGAAGRWHDGAPSGGLALRRVS